VLSGREGTIGIGTNFDESALKRESGSDPPVVAVRMPLPVDRRMTVKKRAIRSCVSRLIRWARGRRTKYQAETRKLPNRVRSKARAQNRGVVMAISRGCSQAIHLGKFSEAFVGVAKRDFVEPARNGHIDAIE